MADETSGPEAQAAGAATGLPEHAFELYKLAVEMADRVSARRGVANTFYLTINTGLVALIGNRTQQWYVALAGVVFCASWWALLKSYRDLNKAKFEIIIAMEDQLPTKVYADEWSRLRPAEPKKKRLRDWAAQYKEQGQVERIVPVVFAMIYAVELVRRISL